jgi:polyphosphate kinase
MADKEIPLFNRELSWLSFNERVLQEAADTAVPLLERLRFLGIYSNNRDEFFRVRVATVRRLLRINRKLDLLQGEEPAVLLDKIQKVILDQQVKYEKLYATLLSALGRNNIHILNENQLSQKQQLFVKDYFIREVQSRLFPIMLDNATDFPYLKDNSIYLVVKLEQKKGKKEKFIRYALIEIPRKTIPRFLVLPSPRGKKHIILLDDVIRFNMDRIFSIFEYDHIESYLIKVTRDAELDLDHDLSKSILEKISRSVKNRKKGLPVRLAYDASIAPDILELLVSRMKFRKSDNLIPGGRIQNTKDFISLPDLGFPKLRYRKIQPLVHPGFEGNVSHFPVLDKRDILLNFPYHDFSQVLNLIREASIDPDVTSIKITLYRLAVNSIVASALINAVKNGKIVTVVVELQARFDEEANIYWANQLQEEGAKVIHGVPGLKVHSKLLLIQRKNKGETRKYALISTGNFNEDTSAIYSDTALITSDRRITEEVEKLFSFYQDNYKVGKYKHLVTAPWDMRKYFLHLINKEINQARKGKEAYIWMKMNSLVDKDIIAKLYQASQEGVKIKLIIRGICSLIPGIKGLSDNIEVISIVDKFLEHSRIFIFGAGGDEKIFLSSADMMSRNLDHRSEVAVPVYSQEIKKELRDYLLIQFRDNCKARVIDQKQDNRYRKSSARKKHRAQEELYRFYQQKKK